MQRRSERLGSAASSQNSMLVALCMQEGFDHGHNDIHERSRGTS